MTSVPVLTDYPPLRTIKFGNWQTFRFSHSSHAKMKNCRTEFFLLHRVIAFPSIANCHSFPSLPSYSFLPFYFSLKSKDLSRLEASRLLPIISPLQSSIISVPRFRIDRCVTMRRVVNFVHVRLRYDSMKTILDARYFERDGLLLINESNFERK